MDDLLNTAPAGFVSFDDNGTILLANSRLSERLGYQPGELEGKPLETIFSVGARIFYHTHFFPLLKMQGLVEEMYFSLRSKSGDDVPVLANAARQERGGSIVNDCVFMRMRQRHKYEDELLRARRDAELASAAKAKFLSMMSHDLRTPLQAISGYASLMLQQPLTDDQLDMLGEIQSAGREMLRLMNDILSFAQLDSGKVKVHLEPVSVADAIARAERLMHVRFDDAKIRYERGAVDESAVAAADPDRLQQVILNLLTNAVKFTPEGESVAMSARREGDVVSIDVADTGIGIAEENMKQIFEPFVQLHARYDPSRPGVGLGLSISRELVRAMGGELTVRSEFGKGSTFTITMRAAAPDETQSPVLHGEKTG